MKTHEKNIRNVVPALASGLFEAVKDASGQDVFLLIVRALHDAYAFGAGCPSVHALNPADVDAAMREFRASYSVIGPPFAVATPRHAPLRPTHGGMHDRSQMLIGRDLYNTILNDKREFESRALVAEEGLAAAGRLWGNARMDLQEQAAAYSELKAQSEAEHAELAALRAKVSHIKSAAFLASMRNRFTALGAAVTAAISNHIRESLD